MQLIAFFLIVVILICLGWRYLRGAEAVVFGLPGLCSFNWHPHTSIHTCSVCNTRSHSITQSLFMKAVMPVRAADVSGMWWYCALLLLVDSVCPCYRGTSPAMMHLLSAWVCSFLPLWVRSLPCRLLSGLLMSGICVSAVPSSCLAYPPALILFIALILCYMVRERR